MIRKYQVTLALLKPDIAVNPAAVKAVTDRILNRNLSILDQKILQWNEEHSERFYKQHKGRFFFKRLMECTGCGGPIAAFVLGGINAVQEWRNIMGPTRSFQAVFSHPYSIRGQFGLTDTRNSTHGSDSEESANDEIGFVFGKKYGSKLSSVIYADPLNVAKLTTMNLGLAEVWDNWYFSRQESNSLEWFLEYQSLRGYILPHISRAIEEYRCEKRLDKPVIIDVGCGESHNGPCIAKDFNRSANIYCLDFATEALLRLKSCTDQDKQFDDTRNFSFIKSNISDGLPFENGSVCAIIDKGTVDSILKQKCGIEKASLALRNLLKSLCSGGVLLQITDEPPEIRLDLLQFVFNCSSCSFGISSQQLLSGAYGRDYFLYTVIKR